MRLRIFMLLSTLPVITYAEEVDLESVEINASQTHSSSNADYLDDSGLNVDVIDTSEYLNSAKDINQILNSTPGIIIRNSGGLGADFKLALNGLSNNQIRYFIDGVPMENFGSALSLDNFLVNQIESVEVYKGVVPTYLSADALGGAINIITPAVDQSYMDASYTYGSFNTHRASFNAQVSDGFKYYSRISTFFNHSDNDYEMKEAQKVTDEFGNLNGTTSATRFHDEYTSRMVSIQSGIINQSWGDELSFKYTSAGNRNNIQHPYQSTNSVFGKFHTRNKTDLLSLHHKLTLGKLSLKTNILSGDISEIFNDTANRRYDWDGSFEDQDPSLGEFGSKSLLEIKDQLNRQDIYAAYQFNPQHTVNLSYSNNQTRRKGNDEIDNSQNIYLKPKTLRKNVFSIGYDHSSSSGLINTGIFVKRYSMTGNADSYLPITGEEVSTDIDESDIGYGVVNKIQTTEASALRLSYERAYRLPDANEIIGFGRINRPNPSLKPERSHNLNLGFEHQYQSDVVNSISEINAFYRDAENFTRFKTDQGSSGIYENIVDVRISGVELSGSAVFYDRYSLQANVTYQDMINQSEYDQDGNKDLNKGSRIPNEPYLFANLRTGLTHYTKEYDEISAFWSTNYVHEYYLLWENLGYQSSKAVIDTQLTHDLELRYAMDNGSYNISATVSNLFDETVYDNYGIQKPGRAYYLKFRYSY